MIHIANIGSVTLAAPEMGLAAADLLKQQVDEFLREVRA